MEDTKSCYQREPSNSGTGRCRERLTLATKKGKRNRERLKSVKSSYLPL